MELPHLVIDQCLGVVNVTPGTDPDTLETSLHGGALVDEELPVPNCLSCNLHHSRVCSSGQHPRICRLSSTCNFFGELFIDLPTYEKSLFNRPDKTYC